ncbi:MAG: alpha-1,2-fucosyltransferase [Terriglobales bacterium]|jgi:hypothetical protein
MGGLGNQMFQYAAGRALAVRNSAELVLDTRTGFSWDTLYRRQYELDCFPIEARKASFLEQLPFWLERLAHRADRREFSGIAQRPWGTFLCENANRFVEEAFHAQYQSLFMTGYWQSEAYFSEVRDLIGKEFRLPPAEKGRFPEMARKMETCNSVAIGVRLFEEVPGATKSGVGGLVPMSYYGRAARRLNGTIPNPEFFVFCTSQSAALDELDLPGPVHFITRDNGFEGTIETLWLLSRCRNHVISNSSFYWWGAWLAEFERPETKVAAIDRFPNKATIPMRWVRISPEG